MRTKGKRNTTGRKKGPERNQPDNKGRNRRNDKQKAFENKQEKDMSAEDKTNKPGKTRSERLERERPGRTRADKAARSTTGRSGSLEKSSGTRNDRTDREKTETAGKTRTGRTRSERPSRPARKAGNSDIMRLNRFLSNSGVCSRREADKYIESGCVTVNGKVVSELGSKVSLSDEVKFSGQSLNPQRKVYLLLNKPRGFVTTTDDPQERKTVMHLVENACSERIYPVGRLDKETSGVLLFTNDGDLSKKLTHPSYQKKKIYHVHLDKPLTKNHLLEIARGFDLEDGFIAADAISYVKEDDKHEVGIEIHSGRNRIVRRIFAHLGYEVKKLDRVYFAGLTKKNLPRGKSRFLTQSEINQLKMQ